MKPTTTRRSRLFQSSAFRLSGFQVFLLASFCLQAFSLSAADAPASATITGRVLNVATGLYLKNAEVRVAGSDNYVYTGEDGSYAITVPAGTVELTASYTGVQTATASIDASASPGANNVLNFELQPLIVDPAAASDATGPVVLLDRFVVTTDREGQAKAIMDQRAAINAVTIISADNFGDITMDSIGEILKYMPGVSIEYGDTDATGARIGGLDSKYTTAALDGVAISTVDRAVDLTTLSATGIETIEFVQTLTANMDAGSAAGRLNFRTKDPFSRRGRQLRYSFGMNGHSTALDLGRAWLPDDRKHALVLPHAQINYGGLFFGRRLAVELDLSHNGSFNFPQRHITGYSYRNPDPEVNPGIDFATAGPVIVDLQWRPVPQIVNRYAGTLNIGYKFTHGLTFSMRGGFFHEERETFALSTLLRAYHTSGVNTYRPTTAIDPIRSSLTHWVVNGDGDTRSRIASEYAHEDHTNLTLFATPRLTYKRGSLSVDLYGGYTGRVGRSRDTDKGFFRASNSYMSNVSWVADRPSSDSPAWTLIQTAGDPWGSPVNWSKREFYNLGIRSLAARSETNQYAGGLDAAYALRVLGMPVTLKAGGLVRRNDYNYWQKDSRYNYLGATGRPQEAVIPFSQNYIYDFPLGGKGGNISDQGWRVDDTYALYDIYREHPDWFTGTLDNLRRALTTRRDLSEEISAAYFELNSRVNRLRLNLGARFENTSVETRQVRRRTGSEVAAAGHPVNESSGNATTEEGILYQYYNGERFTRRSSYSNFFLSGGFKYDITRNLEAQLSASQSILRPDYRNLSGTVSYDENNEIVLIPNATLKPEYMNKYYAGLHWRLEPAGSLRLYAYRMDIRDKQIRNIEISRDEAERIVGFPLGDSQVPDGETGADDGGEAGEVFDDGTIYRTTINSPSRLSVYGVTLEYSQQLTFLPGYLKGLSVFGSVTWSTINGSQIDEDKIGQVKRSANGGMRYRLGRMHFQLRGTWNDSFLAAVTRPGVDRFYFLNDHQYEKARLIVDFSGGFKITSRCEITFSVRNLLDSPRIWYSNTPDRLSRYTLGGSYVNVSVKGSF